MRDKEALERKQRAAAIFTDAEVRGFRASALTARELAEMACCGLRTMRDLLKGRTYAWVEKEKAREQPAQLAGFNLEGSLERLHKSLRESEAISPERAAANAVLERGLVVSGKELLEEMAAYFPDKQ
jgi:hypothetical protein